MIYWNMDERDAWLESLDDWKTRAEAQPSVATRDDEDARERNWHDFIAACRDFAASERDGYSAVIRAVAEAMKGQGELFRG